MTRTRTAVRGAGALLASGVAITALGPIGPTAHGAVTGTATASATYSCAVLGQQFDLPVDFTITATPQGSATLLSASGGRPTLPLDSTITATNVTSTLNSTVDGTAVTLKATTPSLRAEPNKPIDLPTLTGTANVAGTSLLFTPGNFSMALTYVIPVTITCTLTSPPTAVRIPGITTPAPSPGTPAPSTPGTPTPSTPGTPTPGTPSPSAPGIPTPSAPGTPTPTAPGVDTPTVPLPGVTTAPGRPQLKLTLSKKKQRAGKKPATARVTLAPRAGAQRPLTGKLTVKVGKRTVATRSITTSSPRTIKVRLPRSLKPGRPKVTATYTPGAGADHLKASTSVRLRVAR